MNKPLNDLVSEVDRLYLPHVRARGDEPYHRVLPDFARRCNAMTDCRILEIGSREVSGVSRRNLFQNAGEYVGFDFHEGPGVDVSGDAHELSRYFPREHFDAVFSCSVFEHLAFPWKVVMECNRVLRSGGICYVSTHPTWPPHELPWDFWRFPIAGLRLLFSEPLGFRVVESEEGIPGRLHSLSQDAPTRGVSGFEMSMGVALIAEKIGDYDPEQIKWDVPLTSILDTVYPDRTSGIADLSAGVSGNIPSSPDQGNWLSRVLTLLRK